VRVSQNASGVSVIDVAVSIPEPEVFRIKWADGEMAEWSMAVVLKTTVAERLPGVRIPLSPPNILDAV
jgi:hypothetical protein